MTRPGKSIQQEDQENRRNFFKNKKTPDLLSLLLIALA